MGVDSELLISYLSNKEMTTERFGQSLIMLRNTTHTTRMAMSAAQKILETFDETTPFDKLSEKERAKARRKRRAIERDVEKCETAYKDIVNTRISLRENILTRLEYFENTQRPKMNVTGINIKKYRDSLRRHRPTDLDFSNSEVLSVSEDVNLMEVDENFDFNDMFANIELEEMSPDIMEVDVDEELSSIETIHSMFDGDAKELNDLTTFMADEMSEKIVKKHDYNDMISKDSKQSFAYLNRFVDAYLESIHTNLSNETALFSTLIWSGEKISSFKKVTELIRWKHQQSVEDILVRKDQLWKMFAVICLNDLKEQPLSAKNILYKEIEHMEIEKAKPVPPKTALSFKIDYDE